MRQISKFQTETILSITIILSPFQNTIHSVTCHDYQTSSEFFVYEGERADARKNFKIGKVHLKLQNIRPAGKELAVSRRKVISSNKASFFQTTFSVDANGILHVTELEKDTDNCTSIAIQYDGSAHSEVRFLFVKCYLIALNRILPR